MCAHGCTACVRACACRLAGWPWPARGGRLRQSRGCGRPASAPLESSLPLTPVQYLLALALHHPLPPGPSPSRRAPSCAPPRRYLLALDGYTASRRLATLLSINSAVLKQQSRWLEWWAARAAPCRCARAAASARPALARPPRDTAC